MINNGKFKNLRIVDNFYQTSAYFPMPTILISTLDDENQNLFRSLFTLLSSLYCRERLLCDDFRMSKLI